jgi:acyl carrier protein
MMPTPTADAILKAMRTELSVDPDRLTPDATLASLDLSSLDLVSAIFAVEDEFGVEVSQEEASRAVTLQDLIDMVIAKSAAA